MELCIVWCRSVVSYIIVWLELDPLASWSSDLSSIVMTKDWIRLHSVLLPLFMDSLLIRQCYTVNSPLMDTLVSGQLYLRTLFRFPFFPPSQTLYLHIPVSGRGHFWKWIFSLFTPSRKRPLHFLTTVNQQKYDLWQSNRLVGIGFLKLSVRLTWHQGRISVAVFGYPIKY